MFSTPLIDSSSGVATVSAITFGLAPGYCALTTTDGGTTSGYSEMGRARSATRPARKMRSEITPAKIGRSMKKRRGSSGAPGPRGGDLHRLRLRRHQHAGAHALEPLDHDPLARREALRHDAQALRLGAQAHLAPGHLVVGAHHHHEALALVRPDRALADEDRGLGLHAAHAHAGELPRHEVPVRVLEDRAHAHRPRPRVDLVVHELEVALVAAVALGGLDLDRDALQ